MKRFKNILVVITDENDIINNPALNRGLDLANKNKAQLTLMDVIAPPERKISEFKGIIEPEELTSMLVARREKTLVDIAEQLVKKNSDLDVSVKVVIGRDFIEIIRQIVFEKHDLLIKLANDHPSSFDSSDFHLMRKCPQPVWLVKPEDKCKSQKILAAIDLSLENDVEGKAMNAMIMDLASSLAEWQQKELHVLSCWSLYGEKSLRESVFLQISEEELAMAQEKEEQANRDLQKNLISQFDGCKIHGHLIKGHPVDHIPTFAKENEVDVVVMGTVARSGIPGLLIGNTSETILNLIDSSVITLKPSGFESIIK